MPKRHARKKLKRAVDKIIVFTYAANARIRVKTRQDWIFVCHVYSSKFKRLEELRKQRGIKQEDLATALEVSRQTIGSLENGRYNPSIMLAFKIARYFQMSIEEIFIYEEESK